jgi:hypothetical protein
VGGSRWPGTPLRPGIVEIKRCLGDER